MLSERFSAGSFTLLDRAAWRPFPDAGQREAWGTLPASILQGLRDHARAALSTPWPVLPSSLYLQFSRDGNRDRFEEPYFARRSLLTAFLLAECLEDEGTYLERVAEGAWLVCEESSWCIPAHISTQRAGPGLPDVGEPIVDLFAAETAAALAWTAYLLGQRLERVSPLIVRRIRREVGQRVTDPFLARDDFWWMGLRPGEDRPNNWNPWILSNVLAAACLLEEDAERRAGVVLKAMRCLDRFLAPYPRDGGCDEGPEYWSRAGGSVFDCLETLESVSGGRISGWDDPLIHEVGRFIVRAHIAGRYYVNFADASAVVDPPAAVVFGFGKRIGDDDLLRLGAALHARGGLFIEHDSPERMLKEIFLAAQMDRAGPGEPLLRDSWLPDIQVMTSRDHAGSSRGLFTAAKAGHNAESHNHNDIGSFLVYVDGLPLVVDAGVGVYTRTTFSAERYQIWTMQSAWHTLLPTIDGVMQAPGRLFAARDVRYESSDASAWLAMDIANAYPRDAGIERWERRIEHRRGSDVTITDEYALSRRARQVTLSFLTPCACSLEAGCTVRLGRASMPGGRESGTGTLQADLGGASSTAMIESVPLSDERLCVAWGKRLGRVIFTITDPAPAGRLRFVIRQR